MSLSEEFKACLRQIMQKTSLSEDEMRSCFKAVMSGQIDDVLLSSFLTALAMKGEDACDVAAAVSVMKENALSFKTPAGSIDVCGTGGDGLGTYNISTAVAFVLAAAGVPVAKHGNKSVSSKSGSSEVLSALGVNIDVSPEKMEKILDKINICFIYAPLYHSAMKHVASVRATLGFRTIFNLVGPLSNPGNVDFQLIGVFKEELCPVFAEVLKLRGMKRAMIVHGADGLDEASVTGPSYCTLLDGDQITYKEISPQDFGLKQWKIDDLIGGNPQYNAQAMRGIFEGDKNAYRDAVVLNAAVGLFVAEKVDSIAVGVEKAQSLLDCGLVLEKLEALKVETNE